MSIVPAESHLEVEAMISNRDIGFVSAGQQAEVKIDTFNFTRYGLLQGKVINVSQDAIVRDEPNKNPTDKKLGGALSDTSRPTDRSCSNRLACRSKPPRCRSRTRWSISRPA